MTVLSPLFGQTYQRAKAANTGEEFLRSKEAASAAAAWGTTLVGSALQSYGIGALINATGTLSYKGAAYLGGLIFMATSAPTVSFPSSIPLSLLYYSDMKLGLFADNYGVVHRPDRHGEAAPRHRRRERRGETVRDARPLGVPHLVGYPDQPLRLRGWTLLDDDEIDRVSCARGCFSYHS